MLRARLMQALLALMALTAGFGASASTQACDGEAWQTLLSASPSIDERAYWLDRQTIQWPQAWGSAGQRFRLYHAARGGMRAEPGQAVDGADGAVVLEPSAASLPLRFKFIEDGVRLRLPLAQQSVLPEWLRGQLLLVQENEAGEVVQATALQVPGALDDLYASAAAQQDLGVNMTGQPVRRRTQFKLWAPTAQQVWLCRYASGQSKALAQESMQRDADTGTWTLSRPADLSGQYYSYVVDVHVRGLGLVRNRVTDPYAVSLTTDSRRAYVADLDAAVLKPGGWERQAVPDRVKAQTDMVVYELHVRDFSASDPSVRPAWRGKYLAFTERESRGMLHLRALAQAGMTDVHLLPVFDIATIPEAGCVNPRVPQAAADSEAQQAAVTAKASEDCYNWGYDPYHFNAPEGSYATDAADGASRIVEFRQMVMALHRSGLRVGMDVVYNHTTVSGQQQRSVLDRIVPGYYQRLDARGVVEHSTCCDNTATEHLMMGKLMVDSVALWARAYKIDSFRFDLMGHQPRAVMEQVQASASAAAGRPVQLIGEGWNFGEVANGARFEQASQLSLNGSGIGTFNDRLRDAVRGGGAMDGGAALVRRQGYVNGLVYDPNDEAPERAPGDLLDAVDLVRAGLAGSLRDYLLQTRSGVRRKLVELDYGGQPAGYVSQPAEVVNYVENHDNQTLFDINVYKLPLSTSREDRVRVQMLAAAVNMFSQGVAYFHAGIDTLRSKSMDGNSFDSGDWFNRLDWSLQDNFFGSGLPPKRDNGANYDLIRPRLAQANIKPRPVDIAMARDMFLDLLRIRASSGLLRLQTAEDVQTRLRFHNTGAAQEPTVIAAAIDGRGYAGAGFQELLYFINVDKIDHALTIDQLKGRAYVLHPVHRSPSAADRRAAQAQYRQSDGRFTVPARTAVVFILP